MTLFPLIIAICAALIIGVCSRAQWRNWSLLVASILAVYWLQPSSPIRHLDFWLPTACLGLAILVWALTRPERMTNSFSNLSSGLVITMVILLIGLTRYLGPVCCLTQSRPPSMIQIIAFLVTIVILTFIMLHFSGKTAWIYAGIIILLGLFVILKSDPLAQWTSQVLRAMNAQSTELASPLDIRWLGFSYVAFRLLHTLLDRLNNRLPELSLQEFVIYIIFFPAYTAGPIDRVQRFIQDLHQPFKLSSQAFLLGGKRILLGIFNKFVLADSLAIFSLNMINSSQVRSTGWTWILLYAFAFRIYFDFSGYSDIAIGMGQLVGIRLPENFEHPYRKPNLTLFWNSWHMTLAQWFRAYIFNPITRAMRTSQRNFPMSMIILIGQLSTFLLIGLWHGISWNFAIWGAWHGIGLFVNNRWADWMKSKGSIVTISPTRQAIVKVIGTVFTFHFVSLGWVWFALSTPSQSWHIFTKLFGLG